MHVEQLDPPLFAPVSELTPHGSVKRAGTKSSVVPKLVLVVDDDQDLLEVTRFALESEGFTVATAENGAEAFALLRAGPPPAIVLLDLMMPVMNGWAFLDEIAREPSLGGIPIVVLSAAEGAAVPSGTVAFVRKPASVRTLVQVIERHGRDVDAARH